MRILGIDFGEKRIGLAISDPLGITAQGIDTLLRAQKSQWQESLLKLCEEYGVKEVVIGLPVNMNGSLGPKAKEVMDLVPELGKVLQVAVKTWDERLSSRQGGRLMIEEGLSRKKQKRHSDRLAATLLLQNYLESKRQQ